MDSQYGNQKEFERQYSNLVQATTLKSMKRNDITSFPPRHKSYGRREITDEGKNQDLSHLKHHRNGVVNFHMSSYPRKQHKNFYRSKSHFENLLNEMEKRTSIVKKMLNIPKNERLTINDFKTNYVPKTEEEGEMDDTRAGNHNGNNFKYQMNDWEQSSELNYAARASFDYPECLEESRDHHFLDEMNNLNEDAFDSGRQYNMQEEQIFVTPSYVSRNTPSDISSTTDDLRFVLPDYGDEEVANITNGGTKFQNDYNLHQPFSSTYSTPNSNYNSYDLYYGKYPPHSEFPPAQMPFPISTHDYFDDFPIDYEQWNKFCHNTAPEFANCGNGREAQFYPPSFGRQMNNATPDWFGQEYLNANKTSRQCPKHNAGNFHRQFQFSRENYECDFLHE